ncbi:MAG TPA: hypothetical protein DCG14_05465 [Phycisphaerales bacterium]|nr:hypothetical protein [Phycisphaerales bacterium]
MNRFLGFGFLGDPTRHQRLEGGGGIRRLGVLRFRFDFDDCRRFTSRGFTDRRPLRRRRRCFLWNRHAEEIDLGPLGAEVTGGRTALDPVRLQTAIRNRLDRSRFDFGHQIIGESIQIVQKSLRVHLGTIDRGIGVLFGTLFSHDRLSKQ